VQLQVHIAHSTTGKRSRKSQDCNLQPGRWGAHTSPSTRPCSPYCSALPSGRLFRLSGPSWPRSCASFTNDEKGYIVPWGTVGKVSSTPLPGRRLDLVHRIGAAVFGVGLCVFGVLGVANRLEFLALRGKVLLSLGSNGLLATISLIVGGVLIGFALRGGRISSTITAVIGALFLLSGLLNLTVLDTGLNLLGFRLSNVIFSLIGGMLLLFLGAPFTDKTLKFTGLSSPPTYHSRGGPAMGLPEEPVAFNPSINHILTVGDTQ
jgi:hypothetical protein